MRRLLGFVASIAVIAAALPAGTAAAQTTTDYAQYVNPLIGTYPPGFVNPGPALPHGMVGVGPDTEGPLNYGGYHYVNNTIVGFSHVHMSAGVPRGGQIPMMPVAGPVELGDPISQIPGIGTEASPVPGYASPFNHATETAEAGYYSVLLERYGVNAELTATARVGVHRYTFPPGQPASVVIDPSRDLQGYGHPAAITVGEDGIVTGHVVAERGIEVYFAATFDKPFTVTPFAGATPNRPGTVLGFGSDGEEVVAKVALSFTDVAGARTNLEEAQGKSFDELRTAARARWNETLGTIEVESANVADLTSFYTALYHTQLFPNLVNDVDGRYKGFDDAETIHTSTRPHYTQFSLWDSYRGQNQILSVINPDAYKDMTLSLLDMYREGGKLPRWTFANEDPAHMSGDPVIPFIAEGWCRGVLDDLSAEEGVELYGAMRDLRTGRPAEYDSLGYLPSKEPSGWTDVADGGDSKAGTTLEYGVADMALALMADERGHADDRDAWKSGALSYRNLLDTEDTKWIRPKHADGTWLEEFLPEMGYGFQEGTSWQYSWLAMQDLAGLVDRMGGDAAVQERLDVFFNLPASAAAPVVWPKVQNQITIFGIDYHGNQYAPGNEHDLEAPFVYNYAGAPWKTQAAARAAASVYSPTPDGLPGNDDLGALSGWLVWTMLGIYPITPGAPVYTVASPVFDRAVIHMAGGNDLVIEAPGTTYATKYVQAASLDGAPLTDTWLTHGDIADGATLTFTMGAVPNTTWGSATDARPPSLSTHDVTDFGCEADIPFPEETTP
jgi:predicted alpha-1,2-mannosidase